ncbi:MAG: metallophosphoesterase [Gammaproteobacteria bacterium]|nr:metallophosphoesterase [Gammaproteobacteria bacterium]
MINRRKGILYPCLIALSLSSALANAKGGNVTLMQFQDMHGHLAPHAEIFPDERMDPNSGGIAKVTTLIKQVRAEDPDALLLAVGDTTHGSAETLFSLGEAIMPALNSLGIDAFLPGNWDFGYGPRVYRQRFTPNTSIELAPNNRTTIAWMDGLPGHEGQTCNQPGGLKPYSQCHVTKANFPTVAINLFNYNEVTRAITGQTHPGYIIKDVDGTKVAILGITSDVVPQQAQAFNTGFRFTMGYKELPVNIAAAKAEGADLIVVLSELGLAKNVQLVKEFPQINVMFSGHTHERTPEAIVIERGEKGSNVGLVTEAGEDSFLGKLKVKVDDGRIVKWSWDLMEADSTVAEDPDMKAIIDQERATFLAGPAHICHTFGINAFPFGKGHTLCDTLDTVVGHTNVTIERFNVLEEVANNVMVDAFLDLAKSLGTTNSKGEYLNDGNALSTTNGFRFDVVVFGSDDGFSGDVTVGDLYAYYPIGAGVALAEFTGGRLMDHWEGILSNVFDPNPYRQRGGWFLGFTNNMHFDLQLSDDFPRSISDGRRIELATINDGNGPKKIDRSKTYTLASCYPHGNPIDEVCRTSGATNIRFIAGTQESSGPTDGLMFNNRQIDVNGPYTIVNPANTENIWDPVRFAKKQGPMFLKVAPDNFIHPVDALRRYLVSHTIDAATDGLGRVTSLTGVPVSEYGGAGIVQPTQGAGPAWMKREITNTSGENNQ